MAAAVELAAVLAAVAVSVVVVEAVAATLSRNVQSAAWCKGGGQVAAAAVAATMAVAP